MGSEFESRWRQVLDDMNVLPTDSRVHPTYPVDIGALSPELKGPECEADH
jgi:hypothetical protein